MSVFGPGPGGWRGGGGGDKRLKAYTHVGIRGTVCLSIKAPVTPDRTNFLIVRLGATDRQCLLRSPFTIARSGVFVAVGCRSYINLHDNLCIYTFWPAVGRFIVNN